MEETYPNAEEVHRLFGAASLLARRFHFYAIAIEFLVAVLAAVSLVEATEKAAWFPLGMLLLAIMASLFRVYSRRARAFASGARWAAVGALSSGVDIGPRVLAWFRNERLLFADRLNRSVKANTLSEYYAPSCPAGDQRRRELCAHSAFFTWRLMRTYSVLVWTLLAVAAVGSLTLLYRFSIDTNADQSLRLWLLQTLCAVVLIHFGLRALELALSAASSWRATRAIYEDLLGSAPPGPSDLIEVTTKYEKERLTAPLIPQALYILGRENLAREWEDQVGVFEHGESSTIDHNEGTA